MGHSMQRFVCDYANMFRRNNRFVEKAAIEILCSVGATLNQPRYSLFNSSINALLMRLK